MLKIDHLSKKFNSKTVADGISFDVDKGEIVAVLGPSGCGKTTLLNMIAGLVWPDEGEIVLNGRILTHIPPEQRQVALMFQDYALLPHLNVWQNIAFGLKLQGVDKVAAQQQALAALQEVGLAAEAEQRVEALSGGERQRVALARALAVSPDALLLDEPFSSLDTSLRSQLRRQMQVDIRQRALPAVLVTHDPVEAFEIADTMILMRAGQVVQKGKPLALLQQPANAWVAQFLGAENVNDDCYVPQQAILLGNSDGLSVVIERVLWLPEYCRLWLQHPQYGLLTVNIAHAQAVCLSVASGKYVKVMIDESAVVRF